MGSLSDNVDGTADEVLAEITASTETFARHEPGAREKLLLLSHRLTAALETPGETIERIGWAEVNLRPSYKHRSAYFNTYPALFAALRLGIDLNIFDTLDKAGDAAVSVSQLASSTGAEETVIGELIILACIQHFIIYRKYHSHKSGSQNHETPLSHERRQGSKRG